MDEADRAKKEDGKESAAKKEKNNEKVTLNTIYLAGIERGLTKPDMQKMTVGEIVDYIKAYNQRHKDEMNEEAGKKPVKKYRLATPKEISDYHRS